jgi:type VI protein secretion system component VasF
MLGLERLIVGRECNGFDRLPPARKARAFAELIHLCLAYGKVEEVASQDFPNVSVQRVSSRGRRLLRSSRSGRSAKQGNKGITILWVFVALAVALFGCMFLMWKLSGN